MTSRHDGRQDFGSSSPKRVKERLTPGFVGRSEVLGAVLDALREGPAFVVIEGEAGIGKTRLLREALAALVPFPSQARPVALVVTCPPVEEPFPFGALVDALRQAPPLDRRPRPEAGSPEHCSRSFPNGPTNCPHRSRRCTTRTAPGTG